MRELEGELAGEDFWVFPGMEVTCDDAVQCIVLFDPETPIVQLERLYGGIPPKITKPPYDTKQAPQTELSGRDIEAFLKIVSDDIDLVENRTAG